MQSKTVSRAVLAESIHKHVGLSKSESLAFVEMIISEMCSALVNGEDVKIPNFGSFAVRAKSARIGRNPKTGVEATISARNVVSFRACEALRTKVAKAGMKAEI